MGQIKPWQIVVMVLAIVAVGASAYFTFSGTSEVKFADEILMVDVNTGDLFAFPVGRRKVVIAPETNPETGTRSLLSVYKDERGRWLVDGRELGAHLSNIPGDHNAIVDRRSGEVRVNSDKPKKGR